ncbi:M20/M25/M40 family metallo-hydrolase, partial [Mitsuaria sp. TWR114]|uniref:M20/M25/M40 family metallo-hydrolase n=1 Tax=Mitsuaria sp. TWR114 TaxID=2601731 RepID=UPI0011BE81F3
LGLSGGVDSSVAAALIHRAIGDQLTLIFGEPIPTSGTPLYTDVRLYGEHGVPAAIYGAGPRTVLESHAKRADERVELSDLRRATKVVARTLLDLLQKR